MSRELHPFAPIVPPDARVLILGSFPSVKSREEGFYYSPTYVEQDGAIIQQWEKVEVPDEATEADYVAALEGLGVNFGD
jgi:hypothetical protein